MKYTLTCSCGRYTANFDRKDVAEAVAEIHADLGEGHSVTCTRPAHNRHGAVPVIVFQTRLNLRTGEVRPGREKT
jgi:hypothetical protein